MVESIKELRRICQKEYIPPSETIIRKVSIYVTKLLLYTRISANQTTGLSIVVGIVAGVFFIFGDKWSILIGALLLWLSYILDYSDGEVARYRGSASLTGSYIDKLNHIIVEPFSFAALSFGIYNTFHDVTVFAFGFSAAISILLIKLAVDNTYASVVEARLHAISKGTSFTVPETYVEHGEASPQDYLASHLPILYSIGDFMISSGRVAIVLLAAILDIVLAPFTIGVFTFNVIYIFVVLWGLATPFGWLGLVLIAIRRRSSDNLYLKLFKTEQGVSNETKE